MTTLAHSHDRTSRRRRRLHVVLFRALTPIGVHVFDALANARSGDYYESQRPPGWWYLG